MILFSLLNRLGLNSLNKIICKIIGSRFFYVTPFVYICIVTLKQTHMKNQTLKLYGLKESQDGRFHGVPNSSLIQAHNIEEARTIADKITKGDFSKYSGFYHLSEETTKIYTLENC